MSEKPQHVTTAEAMLAYIGSRSANSIAVVRFAPGGQTDELKAACGLDGLAPPERAMRDAACEVVRLWLSGEHSFKPRPTEADTDAGPQ